MTPTPIFSHIDKSSQDKLNELSIPLAVFDSIYDSGQIKSFALAGEPKLPRNPLIITTDDEGKDYAYNANFRLNEMVTWSGLRETLAWSATERYADKKSAQLFSPTMFNTRLWFESPVKPHRGYRNKENATQVGVRFIDADNKGTTSDPKTPDSTIPPLLYGDALSRVEQEALEAALYTTASNVAGEHFRIVRGNETAGL